MPEGKSPPESGGMGEFFAPMVAAIPEWFVYVVLTVMIGGYIAWGYWPHENKRDPHHSWGNITGFVCVQPSTSTSQLSPYLFCSAFWSSA